MTDLTREYVIGDGTERYARPPAGKAMGLVPRDYSRNPVGSYGGSKPFDPKEIKLIPMADWPDLIAEKESKKTRISDIYDRGDNGRPIPSLDQNGQGFCWFYSGTCCIQMLRAINNMPYVKLSAHSGACVIKNFRDQGGWGAAGLDFQMSRGVVPVSLWPEKSMSRSYDTEANWKAALEFRVTEGWVDLEPPAYDRDLSVQEVGSCLLQNVPVIGDFNWWGHSVAMADLVDVYPSRSATDPRRYGTRIKNSWTDGWGTRGWGVLKDSKAWPDGASAPRAVWGG